MIPLKKVRIISLVIALILFSASFPMSVYAGKKEVVSTLLTKQDDEEVLNDTDWNISDSNIEKRGNSVVILSQDATSDTKIVSKTAAKASDDVDNIAQVETRISLTALPKDGCFIMAFGLSSIEAEMGEEGNIELFFTNEGNIRAGVVAYTDDGSKTLVESKNCGVSLNANFAIKMAISNTGMLEVKINNSSFAQVKLPVSGEGRFGFLQTGSCGAVISDFVMKCSFYERPENTDIFEDFESGEFNANLFVSSSNDNGIFPSGVMIEDYNGSKVLRFKNTKLAHFCTLYQYSNFEISFDVPYFSRQYFYDEYGNIIGKPCSNLAVGFGEETSTPVGYSYTTDVDLIRLASQTVNSVNQEAFRVELKGTGITDLSTNEGYSFKLRVIDGHYEVFLKSLTAAEYKLVATTNFEAQRSGYVNIWSTGNGDFAIDNLRITNLDENPNKIDVKYKSSLLKAEDYVPTEKENAKVFRPDEKNNGSIFKDRFFVLDICFIAVAIFACGGGLAFYLIRKKRITGGKNENE